MLSLIKSLSPKPPESEIDGVTDTSFSSSDNSDISSVCSDDITTPDPYITNSLKDNTDSTAAIKPFSDLGQKRKEIFTQYSDTVDGIVELVAKGIRKTDQPSDTYTYSLIDTETSLPNTHICEWLEKNKASSLIIYVDKDKKTVTTKHIIGADSIYWLSEQVHSYKKNVTIETWLKNQNNHDVTILQNDDSVLRLDRKITEESLLSWLSEEESSRFYKKIIESRHGPTVYPRMQFTVKCQAALLINQTKCNVDVNFSDCNKLIHLGSSTTLELIQQPNYDSNLLKYRICRSGQTEPLDLFTGWYGLNIESHQVISESLNNLAVLQTTAEYDLAQVRHYQMIQVNTKYREAKYRRHDIVYNAYLAKLQTYKGIHKAYENQVYRYKKPSLYSRNIKEFLNVGAPHYDQYTTQEDQYNETKAARFGLIVYNSVFDYQRPDCNDIQTFEQELCRQDGLFMRLLQNCIRDYIDGPDDTYLLDLLYHTAFNSADLFYDTTDDDDIVKPELKNLRLLSSLLFEVESCPSYIKNFSQDSPELLYQSMPKILRHFYIESLDEDLESSLVTLYANCLADHGRSHQTSPWRNFARIYNMIGRRIDLIPISITHILADRALLTARKVLEETLQSIRSSGKLPSQVSDCIGQGLLASPDANAVASFRSIIDASTQDYQNAVIADAPQIQRSTKIMNKLTNFIFGTIESFWSYVHTKAHVTINVYDKECQDNIVKSLLDKYLFNKSGENYPENDKCSKKSMNFCMNQVISSDKDWRWIVGDSIDYTPDRLRF